MNRQNTTGLNPSSSSSLTTSASSASLVSAGPSRLVARARETLEPPAVRGVAFPGVAVGSGGRRQLTRRFPRRAGRARRSGRAGRLRPRPGASRLAALVRRVAAAARGEEASARSSASADQYRTRCLSWPPSGSRTVSRAYWSTSSNRSLYPGASEYVRSWVMPVLWEGRGLIEVGADVGAAALHEIAGQPLAARYRFEVHVVRGRGSAGPAGCGNLRPCRCAGWR